MPNQTQWRIQASRLDPNQKVWKQDTITLVTPAGGQTGIPAVGTDGTLSSNVLPPNLRQGLRFAGAFQLHASYHAYDVVTHAGAAYVANTDIASATATPDVDTTSFDLLAASSTGGVITASDVTYNSTYQNIGEALDTLLYEAPVIQSFGASVPIAEVGSTVASVTLNWTYNKAMTSQKLSGTTLPQTDLTPSANTYIANGPFTFNVNWTLTATDEKGATASASASLQFQRKTYWGVSASTVLSNNDILGFSNSFATNFQRTVTYNCSGGKYFYYCYPCSFGNLTKVTIGGLGYSAYTVSSQVVTNASGHNDTYYIVRSNYLQNASNLLVSWA